jgi:hypothetical protein
MAINLKDYPEMVVPGNLDLSNRPQTFNKKEGGTSSVYSMSIGEEDAAGNELTVLIPRVRKDGKIMSEKEAIEYYRKTKEHMGKFRSVEAADRYSKEYSDSLNNKNNKLKTQEFLRKLYKKK